MSAILSYVTAIYRASIVSLTLVQEQVSLVAEHAIVIWSTTLNKRVFKQGYVFHPCMLWNQIKVIIISLVLVYEQVNLDAMNIKVIWCIIVDAKQRLKSQEHFCFRNNFQMSIDFGIASHKTCIFHWSFTSIMLRPKETVRHLKTNISVRKLLCLIQI